MAEVTAKRIGDMEATFGGALKKARAELGVTSFGMAVIDLPAGTGDRYPDHDHRGDGQEVVGGVPGAVYEPPAFSELGSLPLAPRREQ